MTIEQPTNQYDPFNVKPLKIRTRRLLVPGGGSISLTTAAFLFATCSTFFYLLVPLEYIRYVNKKLEIKFYSLSSRPDIIGWNRTALARRRLIEEHK